MMRRTIVALLAIVVVAAGSFAATTGRMTGTVVDNTGLAMPGVTVTISSPQLIGGPQMAVTDVDGGFVFNMLPPGGYKVEANLSGFKPAAAEDVRVVLDRVATVSFTLIPEQFAGEIEVTADVPVVDTTQVNTSVVFDQEYLNKAAVGSGGRDYLSIIGQAAGVAGSGNANVYGGVESDNRFLVDGMNTTDPVTGTFGTNFNYDAIQEITFQTGGFEAEFGQATGGIINLVTKSGGNEFTGTFDARYRNQDFIENGNHFNRKNQTSSSRIISATLGGPILRDKIWFFVSGENVLTQSQSQGAPVVREFKGWNYIGKMTWQMSDNHRLVAKYSADPATIPGVDSSRYVAREASTTQKQGGNIWAVELNSVLSEALLLNAQVGRQDQIIQTYPTYGNHDTIGHYNQQTGMTSGNSTFSWDDNRGRDEARANLSLYEDNLAGSHEFKAGGEYSKISYESIGYYNGGAEADDLNPPANFTDLNGDGYFTEYLSTREIATGRNPLNSEGKLLALFLQDSWRPHANLTVKPGIRFDNVQMTNHVGEKISDFDSWQPRFGISWDIMGNAKHVLRGSAGRFMDSTALSIPSFASGVTDVWNQYFTQEYYCNVVGVCDLSLLEAVLGDATPLTDGSGYTWYLWPNPAGLAVYEPAVTLDQAGLGHLEAPYAEELIFAYETQLAESTSLELTYVDKKQKNIVEDTCIGNTWIWDHSVAQPSLEDPSTWTRNSDCSQYIVANLDSLFRKYTGYIAKFETRREKFHLMGSYTYAKSRGNVETTAAGGYHGEEGDLFPLNWFNKTGYLGDDRRHRVKVNGYLMLPWDITVGIDGFWSSPGRITMHSTCEALAGASQEALDFYGVDPSIVQYCYTGDGFLAGGGLYSINLEPRGATETKSVWQLDLQFTKGFKVGRFDLEGVFTVQNLFGQEWDESFNSTAFRLNADGTYMPIGQPLSYWDPRRYELGFRLEF